MRILAFSDTHGRLPNLDPTGIDRLMIAGNIRPPGLRSFAEENHWLENFFFHWLEALGLPTYWVLGEHDDFTDLYPFTCYESMYEVVRLPSNLTYDVGDVFDDVLLFSGYPPLASQSSEDEDYEGTEDYLRFLTDECQENSPEIWLTHCPPWGVCDGPAGQKPYAGSRVILEAIKIKQPRLVICGRIPNGAGLGRIGRTEVYNVSIQDQEGPWMGKPVIIEI